MILDVSPKKSEFYGLEQFRSDSTLLADSRKGIWTMPPNKPMISERVIKYPHSGKITYVKTLDEKYFVDQDLKLSWKPINEFKTILHYKAQKATTESGGRKWTAWFTTEVPLQDGPYKFSGLPGLILEIGDQSKSHQFSLKGIRPSDMEIIYPELNNYKEIKVTYPQYVKVFRTYRRNPVASLVGKIPDQTDSSGKFISGNQQVREIEKMRLEIFKKDNNILEIELLEK
jgi:GLPGLI family protein